MKLESLYLDHTLCQARFPENIGGSLGPINPVFVELGYAAVLLLETFFHYGSGGLFQFLVDTVEYSQQLPSAWCDFHASLARLAFRQSFTETLLRGPQLAPGRPVGNTANSSRFPQRSPLVNGLEQHTPPLAEHQSTIFFQPPLHFEVHNELPNQKLRDLGIQELRD